MIQLLLLVLFICIHTTVSRQATAGLAFAAGGGFGGSSSASAKKKQKKRKRGGFAELTPPPKVEKKEQKLDKWGLPPPTEDDIFPPLPEGTELTPASASDATSLSEIKEALKDHMTLDYDKFDEQGVERSPSPSNEPMKLKLLYKSPPGTYRLFAKRNDHSSPF